MLRYSIELKNKESQQVAQESESKSLIFLILFKPYLIYSSAHLWFIMQLNKKTTTRHSKFSTTCVFSGAWNRCQKDRMNTRCSHNVVPASTSEYEFISKPLWRTSSFTITLCKSTSINNCTLQLQAYYALLSSGGLLQDRMTDEKIHIDLSLLKVENWMEFVLL